jgi:hypothetical protein
MRCAWVVALLAVFAAAASDASAKPRKAQNRRVRMKKATATAQVETPAPPPPLLSPASSPRPIGSTNDAPPPVALPVVPQEAPVREQAAPWTRVTLTLNPAPMAFGRYGGNVEVMAATHHAIVLSGYVQTFPAWMVRHLAPSNVEIGEGPPSRPGGEIGYRFYSGRRGASGLFAGPSAVAMPIVYPRVGQDLRAEVVSFTAYGAALDLGAQAILDGGFTIGGGVGAMYLAYTPPASIAPPPGVRAPSFAEPHVLPRLLIAAGWSF